MTALEVGHAPWSYDIFAISSRSPKREASPRRAMNRKKARRSGGQEFQGGSAPTIERHDILFRFGGRCQDRKTTGISFAGSIQTQPKLPIAAPPSAGTGE